MDFDIGNLIYIIATLVAIIVGLLGKKKKKPMGEGGPASEPEPRKNNIFEALGKELEGFMVQNQPNVSQPEEEAFIEEEAYDRDVYEPLTSGYQPIDFDPDPDPVPDPFMSEFEGSLNPNTEKNYDLLQSEAISSTPELQVIDLDEDEGQDYFEVVKDFDLETAVIYSAVINRTEY